VGVLVLDSSALITLAGADALGLLSLSRLSPYTVTEVYRETVESALGRPGTDAIDRCFKERLISIQDPRREQKLTGISQTDSLVLLLAAEVVADDFLSNDRTLVRKAGQQGLAAHFTAEFVHHLWEADRISRERRDGLIENFVVRRRYSRRFVDLLFLRSQ